MRKILSVLLVAVLVMSLLSGCNWGTRNFGGSQTIKLESGQRLEMITWKNNDLWILTRPAEDGETVTTYIFQEDSNYGLLEGTITIIETE